MTWLAVCGLFLILCLTGCKKEAKAFTLNYSVECVDNYKVMLDFGSDKHYRLEKNNYYMDKYAHKHDPKVVEGTLTDEEYATLSSLVAESDFFSMKDSYGFEEAPTGAMSDIVYQIAYSSEGKEKYISIRSQEGQKFPKAFIELVRQISRFNDQKLQ